MISEGVIMGRDEEKPSEAWGQAEEQKRNNSHLSYTSTHIHMRVLCKKSQLEPVVSPGKLLVPSGGGLYGGRERLSSDGTGGRAAHQRLEQQEMRTEADKALPFLCLSLALAVWFFLVLCSLALFLFPSSSSRPQ